MKFKYGDLIIKCHRCGWTTVCEELVTDGRAVYLFNRDDSYLRLHCPDCDITMEMCIRRSENVDSELQKEEDEKLPEETPAEEIVQ